MVYEAIITEDYLDRVKGMKHNNFILFLFTFLLALPLTAQEEICDDGIDNDGDGLIDYQDEDCQCDGISSFFVGSIIPNPSFEEQSSLPQNASELDLADYWNQATDATTDYFSVNGYLGSGIMTPPMPFPNGISCVGFITSGISSKTKNGNKQFYTYQEYLGTQLLDTLKQDTSYTLEIDVGYGDPDYDVDSNGDTVYTVKPPDNFTLTIFGHENKVNFPVSTTECILNESGWEEIARITVPATPMAWQNVSLNMKPIKDYNSIAIGEECRNITDTTAVSGYVFVDNIILNKSSHFNFGKPSVTGTICNGDLELVAPDVQVDGNYQWFLNGAALQDDTSSTLSLGNADNKSGYYSVVFSVGDSCIESGQIFIDEDEEYSIQSPDILCAGDSITLDAGAAFDDYEWSTGDTTQSISVKQGGEYSVTVMKTNGCTGKDTIVIDDPVEIDIQGAVTDSDYGQSNGSIDATVSGGELPYTYRWSTSDNTEDLSGIPGGEYILEVWDDNGCHAVDTFQVEEIPGKLKVQITVSSVLCAGDSSGSIEVNVEGGIPPYTIQWPGLNKTGNTVSNLPAGSYDFIITDSEGDGLESSANVKEPNPLESNIVKKSNPTCFASANGSLELNVSGGTQPYNLNWSHTSDQSFIQESLSEGLYTVTITDDNGCTKVQKTQLIAPEELQADISAQDPACFGEQSGKIIVQNLRGGTKPYDFRLNGEKVDRSDLSSLGSGTYDFVITDKNGCTISDIFNLTAPPYLEVQVSTDDNHIVEGDSSRVYLSVLPDFPSDGFNMGWEISGSTSQSEFCDTCQQNTVVPPSTTVYKYEISNGHCQYSDQVTIEVDPIRVYTPNAFTPNNDGVNDRLTIGTNNDKNLRISSLEIFNRWGERVYQIRDIPLKEYKGWNGTYRNQQLRSGTYLYKVDLVDWRGKHFKRQSTVTILD